MAERPETKPCLDCGRNMVAHKTVPIPRGHTVHHGRGLCTVCYSYHHVHGTLGRYPRVGYLLKPNRRATLCREGRITCPFCIEVQHLADGGVSPYEWAARMNTSSVAMARRLHRHRKPHLSALLERIVYAERKAAA